MIYYAEDDGSIRELVLYTLRTTGHEAQGFENGEQLLRAVEESIPSLILLDIMMPGDDGVSVLKKLRASARTRKIPVIMVTARGSEYDRVLGLDSGADDYITKPFGMMEMVSRVKAVLRRCERSREDGEYSIGGVTLSTGAHTVDCCGHAAELTLKEFELLRLLMKNAGVVMTRDMLLESIWGYDFDGETRTVDVHIRTLRSKLGKCGDMIETVRGIGYKISK